MAVSSLFLCSFLNVFLYFIYIYIYRISSINRPGVYFFRRPIYPAFIGDRRLFEAGVYFHMYNFRTRSCSIWRTALAQMASLGSDYYEKANVVKDHHVYKAVWTPFLGEELSVQPEDHNDHDEHAIAVTRDGRPGV